MKIMVALVPVCNNGTIVDPNEKFSCSEEYAAKLIEGKSAKPFKAEKVNFNTFKKEELLQMAAEKGIEGLSEKSKKDEIIDALYAEG